MTTSEALRVLLRESVGDAIVQASGQFQRVGALISGGVDSSSVYRIADDPEIPTFTGWYDAAGFDERRYARLVAGRDHHEVLITPDDFIAHFDDAIGAFRRPWQGPGMFGQWMVARYASQHVDVLLSGEGGDELFGGYVRLQIVAGEPRRPGYEDYRLPDGYPDTVEEALRWDWDRLPDLLAVDEGACGAFGLEAVSPMLDERVVSFAMTLPTSERVGKRLLKDAVRGIVPDTILDRQDKMGFPAPYVQWCQGPLRDFVRDRIGYVPDPAHPFDRGWWNDFCDVSSGYETAEEIAA